MSQQSGYRLPPEPVVDIIDAAPEPAVSFSPDRQWMLIVQREAMPDIAEVSKRSLRLAGIRIDPAANSTFQTTFFTGLTLRRRDAELADNQAHARIELPENTRISRIRWSHNSTHFAYVSVSDRGQQVWVTSVDQPTKPHMLTDRLNTVLGSFEWMPGGQQILCRLVPEDRGAEPIANSVPTSPSIQESAGHKSPTRTFQDLLQNAHDESLFEHYATTQLAIIRVDGAIATIGEPQIISRASASPNGKFILLTTIKKPFSYLMPYRSFPRTIQVWELDSGETGIEAEVPNTHIVAEIPMDENIPIEGVRVGPRRVDWKSGAPATLVWSEALDGGDPNYECEVRDRFMSHAAPFEGKPTELFNVQHRAYGMSYFSDPSIVQTTEYDRDKRWVRTLLHELNAAQSTPRALMDRSIRDRYGDPGRVVNVPDETGHIVAHQDGDWIYRNGIGSSAKGNLPFLDRQNIKTLETQRLWRCEVGTYESVVAMVSSSESSKPVVITHRESPLAPPNYFLRDLESGSLQPLTDFKDQTPQIRGIKRQLITYERSDGVPLSAQLYLPADYQEGTRLPLIVWAYPQEFNDAKTAGQVSGTAAQFTRMRGITHLTLLTQGYAIMDAATMPVIGDPETMNDTFIEQVVDAAQAAIDKAVETGVADRDRVGVGGHSYGAFMTANLMAHCDLFRAGVALSGAYNRTLTPFGFQSERRPYWEAKQIYHEISPFLHADKIKQPLLLIHGENDNNSGTFPIQSQRMYQAIKGNGGTVRLCMLPEESHGYGARQSILHIQAETIEWLDKYVKNAEPFPTD